jgi:hypothetical protein
MEGDNMFTLSDFTIIRIGICLIGNLIISYILCKGYEILKKENEIIRKELNKKVL